jgi:hypothetical protein
VRKLPILACSLLLSLYAHASAKADVVPQAWGLRLGWSAAHFHDEYSNAFPDTRNDFTASVYARFPMWKTISLQPELGWAPKGGAGEAQIEVMQPSGPETFDVRSDHRINYVEMPLLLRLDVPARGSWMPYALLGPELAFRVGTGTSKLTFAPAAAKQSAPPPTSVRGRGATPAANIFEGAGTFDQEFDAEPIDAGITAGLGFLVPTGPVRWGLEGRYTYGLLDVRSGGGFAARNSALAVTAVIELR